MNINMKEIKALAKQTLYSRGIFFDLVLLCILTAFALLLPMLAYVYSSSLMMTLFDEEGENIFLSYVLPALPTLICAIFISFPAISGTYLCGRKIFEGERHTLIEGYTDGYRKNIAFGALLVIRLIPAIIVIILALTLPSLITESVTESFDGSFGELGELMDIEWLLSTVINGALSTVFLLLAIAITFALIALFGKLFLVPYFISDGHGIKKALKMSRDAMRAPQNKGNNRKFLASFAGLLCLSVLTLGLLLIFYVVPLMLMTYNTLAEKMTADEQQ